MSYLKHLRSGIYVILMAITEGFGNAFVRGGLVTKIITFPFLFVMVGIMILIASIHHGTNSEKVL